MAIKQDVELRGASKTIPLRIMTDEKGEMLYQENQGDGADLLNPQDGRRFVDKFDSWHSGGFIPRFIQNGWYNKGVNIDATHVGEIKPAGRRLTYTTLVPANTDRVMYGVSSIAYEDVNDYIVLMTRQEKVDADGGPTAQQRNALNATDFAYITGGWGGKVVSSSGAIGDIVGNTDGFTNKTSLFQVVSGSTRYFLHAYGTDFKGSWAGIATNIVALPAHTFAVGQGRVYKVGIDAEGNIGLSNCDINADMFTAGNWTTPVLLGAYDGLTTLGPAGISLTVMNGIPIVGTPDGLFVVGPGGIPENMTPQFEVLPAGVGNLSTMVGGLGGVIVGLEGRGALLWFSNGGGALVGPDTNPLSEPDRIRIMDIIESPKGDLWVLGHRIDDEDIVLWVGKKQPGARTGPGSYAWHPYLQLQGDAELTDNSTPLGGAGRLGGDARFFPYVHPTTGARYLVVSGGSKQNQVIVLRLDGSAFFGLTAEAEDNQVGTGVTCSFSSGRYARPSRNQCFFTRLRVRGYNFGTSGSRGGEVVLDMSYDGGSYTTGVGTLTNTSNSLFEQTINLNTVAFDAEWRFNWSLNGKNTDMGDSPATITQIQIEGKEIPDKVRVMTLVIEGTRPTQAGGVRAFKSGPTLRDELETLSFSLTESLTFVDPYNNQRTVYIADNQVLSVAEAEANSVPEGSIQLTLVEVV
jgi:hypothetical protein